MENNSFTYQCALTGVADFFMHISYPRKWFYNKAPKWMNQDEQKAWQIGFDYAKTL